MKRKNILLSFGALAIAAGAAFAVSMRTANNYEVKADSYSGRIYVQKNIDQGDWRGYGKFALYLFDGNSHNTWVDLGNNSNNGSTYQKLEWNISFEPTTVIILNVANDWSSSSNPWGDKVWKRTGDVVLSSNDVVWMNTYAKEGSNWGSYAFKSYVYSNSDTKIADLGEEKDNSGTKLENFNEEVTLTKDQKFYIRKASDAGAKYKTFSGPSDQSISTKFTVSGDYIQCNVAGTYAFYFDYNGNSLWITDPYVAAADEWAQAFMSNVGCDDSGVNLPSGWAGEITRYNALHNNTKDIIYKAKADVGGTFVEQAVARYDYAVAAHPSLTKFIKNSSNIIRAAKISSLVSYTENSNVIVPAIIITAVTAGSLAAFLFIRKRKLDR